MHLRAMEVFLDISSLHMLTRNGSRPSEQVRSTHISTLIYNEAEMSLVLQFGLRAHSASFWGSQVLVAQSRLLLQHPSPQLGSIYHMVHIPSRYHHASTKLKPILAIPIALRVIYRDQFIRGPFHLGAFSLPIATAAVLWIIFISIVFILPQRNVSFFVVVLKIFTRC
jgi:hypothetical protein